MIGKKAADAKAEADGVGAAPLIPTTVKSLAQAAKTDIVPRMADRDYVTANMWSYPKN